ncbi:bifunctional DNA primase/polymerase [Streptomyces alkaliphilus]|nr:bifunctional DNA primase/polymerase [Streptomyces alkaliphilus]
MSTAQVSSTLLEGLEDPRGVLRNSLVLAEAGHPILPCYTIDGHGRCTCYGKDKKTGEDCCSGKHPIRDYAPHGLKDATTDRDTIVGWFKQRSGKINFAWRLDGLGVVDIDTNGGKTGLADAEAMQAAHGPLSPTLVIRTGRGGLQHVYELPAEVDTGGYTDELVTGSIDFKRGAGHYVMVPGSKTADVYRIESGDLLTRAPLDGWVHDLALKLGSKKSDKGDRPSAAKWPKDIADDDPWYRALLLDRTHPARGNTTMVRVVGGIAHRAVRDGWPFEMALGVAYNYEGASDDPQDRALIEDRLAHYWAEEVAKQRAGLDERFTEMTGYLAPREDGHGLATLVDNRFGKPEETPFGDFTVTATSVYTRDGNTVWTVDLTNAQGRTARDVELPHEVLASTATLRRFLLGHRCQLRFSADRDKRGSAGVRLQALMESQNPADYRVVSHLGWDDKAQAFVTFEGAITADGVDPDAQVRPSRELISRNLVDHRYGFRSEEETREVLREVLTHHDETVTSVIGAWGIAAVAKGQIMRVASQFPILAVEAPSEAGKSTGFSAEWYQLLGNRNKEAGIATSAALRDAMTAHRGAPVRIDDADTVRPLLENLRQATVEGEVVKMGEDKRSSVRSKLVAPVWISGEGIAAVHEEKAIRDRSLLVTMPSPKGRMSLKDPTRPQWDDIMELGAKYPDGLSVFAGTLVRLVLRHAPARIAEFTKMRNGSGRHADKMATLRVGARILADITGDESHVERVDAWVSEQVDTGAENALTLKVIPAAVRAVGTPEVPVRVNQAPHYGIESPIVYRPAPGGEQAALWVEIGRLAQWWSKHNNGKVSERTETEAAMREQAKALGMKGTKAGERGVDWAQFNVDKRTTGGKQTKIAYQRVPDRIAAKLLDGLGTEIVEGEPRDPRRLTASEIEAVNRA